MDKKSLNQLRIERLESAVRHLSHGNKTDFGRRLGYRDGAFVRQMLIGMRPITEKTVRAVEDLPGMAGWFSNPEEDKSAGGQPAVQPTVRHRWPFPSIPESDIQSLSPTQISAVEGAIALALAQLKLGFKAPPLAEVKADAPLREGRLTSVVEQAHSLLRNAPASNEDEYAYVDRLDVKLAAGHGKIVHHAEKRARLSFRQDWLRSQGVTDPDRAVLVDVEGDSMDPTLPHGATVLVDLNRTDVWSGQVYALAQNGEFFVKRLRQEEDGIFAHSDNRAYQPFPLNESALIIGRVFWVGAAVGEA
jgi:phage repressor protein C with HTH and peptisase S24 domain